MLSLGTASSAMMPTVLRLLLTIAAIGLAISPLNAASPGELIARLKAEPRTREAAVLAALSDPSPSVRRTAADVLAEMWCATPECLAAARAAMKDRDLDVRALAALALKWDEASREEGRQFLVTMLSSAQRP